MNRKNLEVLVRYTEDGDDPMAELEISVIEFNSDINYSFQQLKDKPEQTWMYKYLGVSQTYVFVAHSGGIARTIAWEILYSPYHKERDDQWLVIQLNNFVKHFHSTPLNTGRRQYLATGSATKDFWKPRYLVSHWEIFDRFNFYAFCSFLQHHEDGECKANP